jgi:hypothetical protein
VTLDADFHAILAVSGASGPSVIRLRLQGLGAPEAVDRVQNVLARLKADLERGYVLPNCRPRRVTGSMAQWMARGIIPPRSRLVANPP